MTYKLIRDSLCCHIGGSTCFFFSLSLCSTYYLRYFTHGDEKKFALNERCQRGKEEVYLISITFLSSFRRLDQIGLFMSSFETIEKLDPSRGPVNELCQIDSSPTLFSFILALNPSKIRFK